MNTVNATGRGALLCALLGMTMMTPALADPPGEDILYPGGMPGAPGGNVYLQFDVGANQSELYGAKGIHGGVGEPGILPGYLKSANGTAPFVAATIGYQFTPAFSFAMRFDYDVRYASNSGDVASVCTDYDELGEPNGTHPITLRDRYEVGISYLGVAFLPTVHVSDFFLFAGPAYSAPISRDIRQTVSVGEDDANCQFFYGTNEATTTVTGRLSGEENIKDRLSLKFGVGYSADLGSGTSLVLQAGYDLGLDEVFQEQEVIMLRNPDSDGNYQEPNLIGNDLRFNSFQGSIGIRVNL